MARSMTNGTTAKKIPGKINVRSLFHRKGPNEEYLRIEKNKAGKQKEQGHAERIHHMDDIFGSIAVQYEDTDDGNALGIVHPCDAARRFHDALFPCLRLRSVRNPLRGTILFFHGISAIGMDSTIHPSQSVFPFGWDGCLPIHSMGGGVSAIDPYRNPLLSIRWQSLCFS